MAKFKRKTATKLLVQDILTASYIKRPGWDPSVILTKYGEVSRINLMGVIVSLSKEDLTFLIDDGSGNIQVRLFENNGLLSKLNLGDLITVIGRPREWNSSKYIVPEIIRPVNNNKWHEVHQLQIKLQNKSNKIKLPVEQPSANEEVLETGPYQKILNTIAMLDKGNGADVQDIISNLGIKDSDKIINNLLEAGEIFELSPGRVKILD